MICKKNISISILTVFVLFSMASVCAGDVNDAAIASTDTIGLSQSEEILTDNLKATEGDSSLAQPDNGGVISETTDNGTFKDLQTKIDAATGGTVNLMNNYTFNVSSDNEGTINITKAITINGNGFTINALEKSRIFNITASSNIVLNNITFVNGKSDLGGAIIFQNDVSDVVIDNCKFINNSAGSNGGALYAKGTFVNSTINNTEFINNTAGRNGGAVYITNSSKENLFENLTFSNNKATRADGGAINFHWELLNTTFNNITFFNNSAGGYGGAINTDQDANTDNKYVNVNFINNTANKGGALGGYGQSYNNSFDGCLFANNSATNGGAIYYARNIESNVFKNCSFIKNNAKTGNGGALYVLKKFTNNSIVNTEFMNNTATANGGAVYICESSNRNLFENLTFANNKVNNADGGAINFHGELLNARFNNITFFNNSAKNGGGAINNDAASKNNAYVNVNFINNTANRGGAMNGYGQSNTNSFDGCLFANNSANNNGGAICYSGNIVYNVFENCSFIKNNAKAENGGVIFTIRDFNYNSFDNDSFINNSAAVNGGALYVTQTFTDNSIVNTEFMNNTAGKNGGAVYINGLSSGSLFENLTFVNNRAENKDGGAINFHMETSGIRFNNITFFKNHAGSSGGAVNTDHNVNNDNAYVNVNFINNTASNNGGALNGYGRSNSNSFDGCLFANNSATNSGGAIYYKGNITYNVFENCSFIKNIAITGNGSAISTYRDFNYNSFDNDSFINNGAAVNGGALYINGTFINNTIGNTEFINNTAGQNGGALNVNGTFINNTIGNIDFINNSATKNGGAVYINSSSTENLFENSTFANNKANSADGGAINFHGELSNTKLNNITFFNNSAKNGGGAINTDNNVNDNNTYVNVNFISNTASKNGGAMNGYGYSNSNSFDGCLFANNSAKNSGGAIYYARNIENNTFENCSFINNTAGVNGGAIYIYWNSNSNKFNKNLFINNSATNNAGAIYCRRSSTSDLFNNTEFRSNSARKVDGGSISVLANLQKATFNNVTFINNAAAGNGGTINVDGGTYKNNFINSRFINNTASKNGGAISFKSSSYNEWADTIFSENKAINGGAINAVDKMEYDFITNSVFINNTASKDGGAIYAKSQISNPEITYSSFINNTASIGGAINFENMIGPVTIIAGTFINNTGDSVIKINESNDNSIIRDSIFINNEGTNVEVDSGSIELIKNWFGNNATNYNELPDVRNVIINNWLFLNATLVPDALSFLETANVTFKVYVYNQSASIKVSDYDNSLMPLDLSITQTNGKVNQSTVVLGKNVKYTPDTTGKGSVTAKFEDIKNTLEFYINKEKSNVVINNVTDGVYNTTVPAVDYYVDNATTVTFTINTVDGGTLVFNETIAELESELSKLDAGTYTITIYNAENNNYSGSTATSDPFSVYRASSSVVIYSIVNVTYGTNSVINFTVINCTETSWSVVDINIGMTIDSGTGLDNISKVYPAGNYCITVNNILNDYYNASSASMNFTVYKADSNVVINDIASVIYNDNVTVSFKVTNATSIKYNVKTKKGYVVVNSTTRAINDDLIISGLDADEYIITIVNAENENYRQSSASSSFNVSKANLTIEAKVTGDLVVGDKINVTFTLPEYVNSSDIFVFIDSADVIADSYDGSNYVAQFDSLSAGNHTVLIFVSNDINYNGNKTALTFEVSDSHVKENTTIAFDVVVDGSDVFINGNLNSNATGFVVFEMDGYNISAAVKNGKVTLNTFLKPGDYNITVTYLGDGEFNSNTTSVVFTVPEVPVITPKISEFGEITIGDDQTLSVVLRDETGNVIANAPIAYAVNGVAGNTTTADDGSFIIPAENATVITITYKGNETVLGTNTTITFEVPIPHVKQNTTLTFDVVVDGSDVTVTGNLNYNATGFVIFEMGSYNISAIVKDGKTTFSTSLKPGDYNITVTYLGDDEFNSNTTSVAFTVPEVPVITPKISEFGEITIGDDQTLSVVLRDETGNVIANAPIAYAVNGVAGNTTTADDGSFAVKGENGAVISINYEGNETVRGTNLTLTLNNPVIPPVVKVESRFNITDNSITIYGYAVDVKAGEQGMTYMTELLDVNGKPISGVLIQFAVNNKIYNRTTLENGSMDRPYHLDMVRAGRYTMAFSFGGNDNYTSTFAVVCVDLDKKPITIKASAKTYKATAKTKKYTVTLKTIVGSSLDGKAHLRSGLKVTMKLNGKTYTGKTNSKGQVTFKLKITKKAKFKAVISYKGDKTYEEATKNVYITIK